MRRASPRLLHPDPGRQALSAASVAKPDCTFFRILLLNVISSTTAMRPLELVRTVNSTEGPVWALTQVFSRVLPSTNTRRPLLNSKWFFSAQTFCGGSVTPAAAHDNGLKK